MAQLGEIGRRIETLRLVHERLSRRDAGTRVALRRFLEELLADIAAFHEAQRRGVALDVRVEDHDVEADLAIPVELHVNEFVANGFEHAFAERGERIEVRLAGEDDMPRLEMADDGSGLPEGFGKASGVSGTGARIIAGLAAQIGGGAEWLEGPGARLAVRFPAAG